LIEKIITQTTIQPIGEEIFNELMIFLEAVAINGKNINSEVLGGSSPTPSRDKSGSVLTEGSEMLNDENFPDNE
jgi:hypothetical protein